MKTRDGICLAIILLVAVFYLLTIRDGQPWPDDFAMYIHEAKNLAEHTPLAQTGYIYNPYNPSLGPTLYPPVFPALLIPSYLIGRVDNLRPMQFEIVIFFVALLLVLWRTLGTQLSGPYRATMLAIIGFSPLLWSYKDLIMSDIPFAFFLYLALAGADGLVRGFDKPGKKLWQVASLAGLVYVCYGMRIIGIVLIPALFLLATIYWKRGGRAIAASAFLALLPCLIQWKLIGGEATYADELKFSLPTLVADSFRNAFTYSWSMATFWENPYTKILRDIIFVCFSLLAAMAYFRRIRTSPRIYEIFLPLYLCVLLLYPNAAGARYLIPIFPLYVVYGLEEAESIRQRLKVPRVAPILVPLLSLVFLSYGLEFHHSDFGPYKEGVTDQQSRALFSFIKSNTSDKDVFVFRRPRALALFTDRSASVYPLPEKELNPCHYFQTIGATYLIEAPVLDDPAFDEFLKGESPAKELVFRNASFGVFRVRPDDLERCADHEASATPNPLPLR